MLIIGHRGAKSLGPENTLASINKALEHNVDEVEIDVRVTKDNVPVLIHNSRLKIPGQKPLKINQTNYDDLLTFKPDLTTLETVMEQLNGKAILAIEIKEQRNLKPIINIIKKMLDQGWTLGRFSISSFNYKTLVYFKNNILGVRIRINEQWSGVRAGIRARRLGTKALVMQQKWLWSGYVTPLNKRGYKIYAYTVNDHQTASRLNKYGVYGIVTDCPDLFEKTRD